MSLKHERLNIRKGDEVIVLRGADRGKKGKVLRVLPKKERLVVEKVRLVKRHTRPNQQNPQGGIIEKEAPIHVSNVMLLDPEKGVATRVGHEVLEDGSRVRIARKSGTRLAKNEGGAK
ncbi:MAG: 50S ribosomal protein L24 [Bdellovibrionota bacterium]